MKQPESRYTSAAEMAAAVRAVLGEAAPPALGRVARSTLDAGTALLPGRAPLTSTASTVPTAPTVPTASSVFVGPGGELVDREAATAVIPHGRRTPERRPAAPPPAVRSSEGRPEPAAPPRPLPASARSASGQPAGRPAAGPAAHPSSRPGRTALAVTAGAVAVAATIWLVAANAVPTAPPTLVAVPSPPPSVAPATPTPEPTVAPAVAAPQDVTVPQLAGLPRADAAARLAAAGLTVGAATSRDGIATAGTVLETQPAPGAPVAPGTAVALVVASGRNAVPELHGQTMLSAGATLSAAGFAVVERSVVDSTVPDRTVLGSEPGAGTVVALGETVTVVVSRLPAQPTPSPTPTPITTPPTRPPAP